MYAKLQPNTQHHLVNIDKAIQYNDARMIDTTIEHLSIIKPSLIDLLSPVLKLVSDNKPDEARRVLATIRKLNAKPSKVQTQQTKQLNQKQIADIVESAKAGATATSLCKSNSITYDTLRKIKIAHGVPCIRKPSQRTFTDSELLSTHKATGFNVCLTAEALKVNRTTVAKRLKLIQ